MFTIKRILSVIAVLVMCYGKIFHKFHHDSRISPPSIYDDRKKKLKTIDPFLCFIIFISSAIHGQEIVISHPNCCGDFELGKSNPCFRPSCYNNVKTSKICPQYLAELCVCKSGLVYNDCSQTCIPPEQCPPLCVLQSCVNSPDPYNHCN